MCGKSQPLQLCHYQVKVRLHLLSKRPSKIFLVLYLLCNYIIFNTLFGFLVKIKKQKKRNRNYNNGKNYNSFFYRLRNKAKVFYNPTFFVSECSSHKYI